MDAVIHVSFISGVFELDHEFHQLHDHRDRDDPFTQLLDLLDFLPHELHRHEVIMTSLYGGIPSTGFRN
jgi:hypothetical protein